MNARSKKRLRILGLIIFFFLGIKILSPYIQTIPESISAMQNLNYCALVLAILFEFLRFVGCAYLINSLLGLFNDHISSWHAMAIVLASASFGMVAGGMAGSIAASVQWLHERNIKMQAATFASILPNVLNNLAILLLSLIGVLYLQSLNQLTPIQLKAFLIVLFLLVLVFILFGAFLIKREKSTSALLSFIKKISKTIKKPVNEEKVRCQINEVYEVWDVILKKKWWKPILGILMSFGFDMAALCALFCAAGEKLPFKKLIIGYGLPQLLGKAAFVLPGGIGVLESSMIELYQMLGISDPIVVIVVLAYRFLAFLVPTLIGFLLVVYLLKWVKKEKVESSVKSI